MYGSPGGEMMAGRKEREETKEREIKKEIKKEREVDENDLLGFCSDALGYALNKGAEDVEVYAETIEQKRVSLASNSISSVQQLERRGMGIRVFIKEKMAFASVNALAGHRLKSVIEKSIQLASRSPYYGVLPDQADFPEIDLYDPALFYMQLEEVGEYAQYLVESVKMCDKRMHVESGMVLVNMHKKAIATSKGIEAKEVSSTAVWELLGVAKDGVHVSDFDYQCEGTHWQNKIHVEEAVQRLTDATIPALKAHTCKNFHGGVILAPGAVSTLASHIAEAANAYLVQKGVSALKDKLHTEVVSPHVTLCDDALLPDGLASSSFDREGVPHHTVPVIERGVLTSFLHDATTASSAELKSTGHAAGGYRSRPEIEPTNLLIHTGNHTIDELLSDIRHGVMISRLSGSPDILTGEFSLVTKNAVTICRGELSEPVRGLMFSGNLYDILNNVTDITCTSAPLGNGQYPYIQINPQQLIGGNLQ